MTMPVLYAALGSAICSRVKVFNIALEAQMLLGAFVSVLMSYYTHSALLAVLSAMAAGMLVALVVAILQVKFQASDMVVGTSLNLLISGLTTYLLFVLFNTKGAFNDSSLVGLPKMSSDFLQAIPVIGTFLATVFGQLTLLDCLGIVLAVAIYIFMFKTIQGFRLLSVGVNKQAAISQGIHAERIQILAVLSSGLLCGIGGVLLTLGQVTMYTENITSGRGFFAMAASSLGRAHPIGVILSSFFFGFAEAIGFAFQNFKPFPIKSQLTAAVPYIATIIALILSSDRFRKARKNHKVLLKAEKGVTK